MLQSNFGIHFVPFWQRAKSSAPAASRTNRLASIFAVLGDEKSLSKVWFYSLLHFRIASRCCNPTLGFTLVSFGSVRTRWSRRLRVVVREIKRITFRGVILSPGDGFQRRETRLGRSSWRFLCWKQRSKVLIGWFYLRSPISRCSDRIERCRAKAKLSGMVSALDSALKFRVGMTSGRHTYTLTL